ncbi:ATP-binding protein [Actinokineospora soli]|uniref:ATP-binding protein n=1 Tax=Actinokineospora soli TaxID=1048753 RepID=A0ABW2TY68_9PSEU
MHVAAGQTLVLTVTPDDVPRARRALKRWLMDAGIAELSACDIVLGATEAAAEAIAHAASRITVTAAIEQAAVVLTVVDDGRWRDPETGLGTLRGHALTMVEAASAHFEIAHADDRTTLTARFRLETA